MEGIYVDVREKDEWDQGHIKGAIHCPLSMLKEAIPQDLPTDEVLYIYCAMGGRAQIAKNILLPTHPLAQSLPKGYEELMKDKKELNLRVIHRKAEKREKRRRYRF